MFQARARRYRNSLAMRRSPATISRRASTARWSRTRIAGLPTLHRYFALRQRMLNLPDLHYYDIYPPLVRNDRRFTLADMRTVTLEALRPLGPEYGRLLAQGDGGALDGSLARARARRPAPI